ncbi:MAG TPA: class I SAM-dependent methyltransferase [Acidimicrobiales bacterium]|jgi:SAM-dependent methyltransferase|nr:class I SAM-dependent methyltransferase [Acidimicrobiales bacterium]
MSTAYRFYGDLARWWPLISPPDHYTEEAEYAAALLRSAAIPVLEVLELGSGGGHNASHLKQHFTMTLVDLSRDMVAVSQELNPECEHLVGDMRSVRLDREYDAVFVHDAVSYMTSEDDLRQVAATCFAHCRPGGVAVVMPDETAETYEPDSSFGGTDGADGSGVRYLEWSWDPDPSDSWTTTEYVFLLREADGSVQVAHETHRTGLFGRDVWLRVLTDAGFDVEAVTEVTSEDREPREIFVAHRPPV